MSRAFVRDDVSEELERVPERPISPRPNFVTQSGYEKIEQRLRALAAARDAAAADNDRVAMAPIERDLRYWRQRRSSARIVPPPATPEIVRFGVTVQVRFEPGGEQSLRLVGEDEADPSVGLVSWASPVGSALIGRCSGDVISVSGRQAEILGMHA
ncbi:MAG TPA: GreA/GreB family elongation factor [Steroidobacteraceae bacterium]|jgi:transcription elongation GreA/GreB family factor